MSAHVHTSFCGGATLVIGDIHHHTVESDLLERRAGHNPDRVVYLGDYFDDFGDTPERMRSTCRWLNETLDRPNRIHLLGNHDLPYFNPDNPQLLCPGWSREKQHIFDRECRDIPRDRFFIAVEVDGWLLSHAGFHPRLAGRKGPKRLVQEANAALLGALDGKRTPILGCGYGRGGGDSIGGVTWLDWDCEFDPIPRLNQIVGHTPSRGVVRGHHMSADRTKQRCMVFREHPARTPLERAQPGPDWISVNWCIDCHGQYAALIQGKHCTLVGAFGPTTQDQV